MKSKEEQVLELFFNNPTREWHFEEILKEVNIARSKATGWLKQFMKEGLIMRIKERGKMPYYIGNYESPAYKNRKKIFALNKLYDSGFLNHLSSLQKAKTSGGLNKLTLSLRFLLFSTIIFSLCTAPLL